MKKVVLFLLVFVSTMVQGGNEPISIIPGKGTGDRVLVEDTRQERMNQKVREFIASKKDEKLPEVKVIGKYEMLSNYQKQGYKLTVQSSSYDYSVYILTKGYSSVGLTFEGDKLIDKVVVNL